MLADPSTTYQGDTSVAPLEYIILLLVVSQTSCPVCFPPRLIAFVLSKMAAAVAVVVVAREAASVASRQSPGAWYPSIVHRTYRVVVPVVAGCRIVIPPVVWFPADAVKRPACNTFELFVPLKDTGSTLIIGAQSIPFVATIAGADETAVVVELLVSCTTAEVGELRNVIGPVRTDPEPELAEITSLPAAV
jgi:hypothetical protein